MFAECKGRNCECTDGKNHSKECLEDYENDTNGVIGNCLCPMWLNGSPAGICGEKSFGKRPFSRLIMNYSAGRLMREDGLYDGYIPFEIACPMHGGKLRGD